MPYLHDTRKRKGDRHRAGYYASRRARREFVAVDGEGVKPPRSRADQYVLLADSDGRSLWNPDRLSTRDCLDFLLDIPERHRAEGVRTVVVGFGLSYDVAHWLRDLPESKVARLLGKWHDCLWGPYRIRYVPHKWFEVWRIENGMGYVRLDDTQTLFGGSFVQTVRDWLGEGAVRPLLTEGKARRGGFRLADRAFMESYNSEELRLMVRLMERLQGSLDSVGARPTYYSSPAVLGKWYLTQHQGKSFLPIEGSEPPEVISAYARAFFGGRIETAAVGLAHRPIVGLDLNSAYPAEISRLPNLSNGRWEHGILPERTLYGGLGLVRVRWDLREFPRTFYPFPFRNARGGVCFPPSGTGWVWTPEFYAARDSGGFPRDRMRVLDSWGFFPKDPSERPFEWVRDLYEERRRLKTSGDPAQYVLKIAYNSIYGAFAQQVALDPNRRPRFHHLGYAGLITSGCRAQMYRVAADPEHRIVSLATDGIYGVADPSAASLQLPRPNAMGSFKREDYLDLQSVQSGVYRLLQADGTWIAHGRGYGGVRVPFDGILRGWAAHVPTVEYEGRERFVGPRLAIAQHRFEERFRWEKVPRTIQLASAGSKRNPLPRPDLTDPSAGLVWTAPYSLVTPWDESAPYRFKSDRAKAEMDSSVESEMEDMTTSEARRAVAGRSLHPLRNIG